jgi:hypothetical protein
VDEESDAWTPQQRVARYTRGTPHTTENDSGSQPLEGASHDFLSTSRLMMIRMAWATTISWCDHRLSLSEVGGTRACGIREDAKCASVCPDLLLCI